MRFPLLISFVALSIAASCSSPIAGLPPGDISESARQQMIVWHNQLRQQNSVGSLTQNAKLMAIAQQQAEYNAFKGRLDHVDGNGGTVRDRAVGVGYGGSVSENLGYGLSAQEVFQDWIDSAPHFAAMTDPGFTEIGVGRATSGIYEFWCVVFGEP